MNAPVLEALEARAGASDQDREAWLAERRSGITATEVRDLYLRRISMRELALRKLGRVPEVGDLSHIAVIAWGNEREPVIAAKVQQRFGIRPESRVFRAADEPRFLASPDGVGINFDEELQVCEIKTTGRDIPPWSDAYAEKGYEIQQQWVMRVLGAHRSLFAWEIREELNQYGGGALFVPGELQFEWVPRNDRLIEELEALAFRFFEVLAEVDAEGAEPIDAELDRQAAIYLRGLDLEKQGKAMKEPAYRALLEAGRSQVSAFARVTYSQPDPVLVDEIDFDGARHTARGAELFQRLQDAQREWDDYCEGFKSTKEVIGRPTLRVTAIKEKEEES